MKEDPVDRADSAMDRAIRQALDARASAAPSGACLDAETIAAWADRALSSSERAAAEAHAADCARCQALLAAMVRTSPPEEATTWWRFPAVWWLVPLTGATAAVVLWVVVGRAPAPTTPAEPRQLVVKQEQASDRTRQLSAESSLADNKENAAPTPRAQREARDERRFEARARQDRNDTFAPQPSIAPAAPQALDKATAGAPPPTAAVAESAKISAFADSGTVIASPDRNVQWRLVSAPADATSSNARQGGVQRTTDGGATWQTQQTGVAATLVAGASPSPFVCWLVGRGGTVLLSTDGASWHRVPFPEAVDLVSIRAIDDRTATVTAGDGRTFSTTDAGRTWAR